MFISLDCCDSVVTHLSLVILEHASLGCDSVVIHLSLVILEHASLGCDSVSTHVPIHLF
jgi:hypothetical protein